MVSPTWLGDALAGLMLVTSTYCVARLVAARAWQRTLHRDTNIAHTADGIAMAGMLVGAFRTLPNDAWEVVFAALTIWFGARGVRFVTQHGIESAGGDDLSHYLSHLAMSGAMLYMFVETSGAGGGSATSHVAPSHVMVMGAGAGTSNLSELTLLFVIVLFASAVWHADSLSRYTTTRRPPVAVGAVVGAGPVGVGAVVGADGPSAVSTMSFVNNDTTTATASERAEERAGDDQARWLAPRLEMACHIALCITMGYMLILLL
jgi:hypothetical protein